MTKEQEEIYREDRIRKYKEDQGIESDRLHYERTIPEYNLIFPDEKKSAGDEYLKKWRLEKLGVEVK